jgi:hypothetical protein
MFPVVDSNLDPDALVQRVLVVWLMGLHLGLAGRFGAGWINDRYFRSPPENPAQLGGQFPVPTGHGMARWRRGMSLYPRRGPRHEGARR